jgi:hypothetical protein
MYCTPCGHPSHTPPVGQGGKGCPQGVINDSKITIKSNCRHTKTEGPATHHGLFFSFFFYYFFPSSFPIWLKISIKIMPKYSGEPIILCQPQTKVATMSLDLMLFSPPWLPTVRVHLQNRPLNQLEISPQISPKLA